VRTGQTAIARAALERLSAMTAIEGSGWAKGLEARSRALVSEGREAEQRYAEAVERLGRTQLRPELARAHLLYGEWLRRENRRLDARYHLHAAYNLSPRSGPRPLPSARGELLATGEKVREREVDTRSQLTSQEEHIIRLARDGRTNREIAAELFISTRTVEWHFRKVFAKLGITSRRDLHNTLPPPVSTRPATSRSICTIRPGGDCRISGRLGEVRCPSSQVRALLRVAADDSSTVRRTLPPGDVGR
jgi:DNA-binding CsgD family transcriptional regulator